MKHILSVAAILMVLSMSTSAGDLYRWVDGNRITQYSTTLAGVPERFRPSARLIEPAGTPEPGQDQAGGGLDTSEYKSSQIKEYASLTVPGSLSGDAGPGAVRSYLLRYPKLSLSSSDFRYFPYLVRVKRHIEGEWEYPEEARLRGEKGRLKLQMALDRRGQLLDVTIVRPSRHESLNTEALRAVREAGRFPRVPGELGMSGVRIEAEFHYTLDHWWQKKDITLVTKKVGEPSFEDVRNVILNKLEKRAVLNDVRLGAK